MKYILSVLAIPFFALAALSNGITNLPATSITSTSATITASCAGGVCYARLYWGLTDGGTNAWAHTNAALPVSGSTFALTNYLSGLIHTNQYFYRWSIDGDSPGDPAIWAAVSTNFSTLMTPGIPTGFPAAITLPVTVDLNGNVLHPTNLFSSSVFAAAVQSAQTPQTTQPYVASAGIAGSSTNAQYSTVAGSSTNSQFATIAGSSTNSQFATTAGTATNLASYANLPAISAASISTTGTFALGTNTLSSGTNGITILGNVNIQGILSTGGVALALGGTTLYSDGNSLLKDQSNILSVNPRIEGKADLALFYREVDHSATFYSMTDYFLDSFNNTNGVSSVGTSNAYYQAGTPKSWWNVGTNLAFTGYHSGVGSNYWKTAVPWGTMQPIAGGAFSWSMWFKAQSGSGNSFVLIYPRQEHGDQHMMFLSFNYASGSSMAFMDWTAANAAMFNWSQDTNWHHIVVTFTNTAGGSQIWLDGTNKASANVTQTFTTNALDNFAIGVRSDSLAAPFTGWIDQTLIFNAAISPQVITNLYNNGKGLYHDGSANFNSLIAGWEFDDSGATNSFDFSTNNRTLYSTGSIARVASSQATNPAAVYLPMAIKTIPIPALYSPTNYRSVVWTTTTNVQQQVSRDGTNWNDAVLSLAGMSGSGTANSNYMWSASGSFTNVGATTNLFIRTTANSSGPANVLGHSISFK